jgi:hypothetical protein
MLPLLKSPLQLCLSRFESSVKRSLSSLCADLHGREPAIRRLKCVSHLNALDSTLEQGLKGIENFTIGTRDCDDLLKRCIVPPFCKALTRFAAPYSSPISQRARTAYTLQFLRTELFAVQVMRERRKHILKLRAYGARS